MKGWTTEQYAEWCRKNRKWPDIGTKLAAAGTGARKAALRDKIRQTGKVALGGIL